MSQPDPDDTPTRHGETRPPSPGGSRPEDRTLPAFDRQGNEPKPPPAKPAPVPPPVPPKAGAKPPPYRPAEAKPPERPAVPPSGPSGNDPHDPLFGKVLGGCRLTKLLGRGAMGAVYKARQEKLDRDVAVKIIRPEMMTDQRMLKRFEVEARIVGKFNSANVVMVHDVGFELGVHYLVMEFVQGKNLRDHVKLLAGGRLPAGEALPLLRQAIKGLEEAQRLHVVHRDIKPDNLMITDRAVLKIADFGIAKPLHEDFSMTMTSELVGTPLYMSPEQCQGEAELDFRSDMYSLGATFYYLLTGEPPIRASSVYELIQTKTKMASLCLWKALPGLDENNPLSRVIERMTSLAREDRYGSYEELLNDLVLVEAGQTIVPKPSVASLNRSAVATRITNVGGKGKAGAKRGMVVGAIVLLLAAAGGGYAWMNRSKPPVIVDNTQRVVDALDRVRQSLRDTGPSVALQTDLGKIATGDKGLDRQRNLLLEDVEAGLVVRRALEALKKPTTFELPFDEVVASLTGVAAAAKPRDGVGPEVAAWCSTAGSAARSEEQLGPKAVLKLVKTFTEWKEARSRAGNDEVELAGLRDQLDLIEASRTRLNDELITARDQLREDLKPEELDAARRSLTDREAIVPDPDVATTLASIRSEFETKGPDESLLNRAKNLGAKRTEQVREKEQLVNAIAQAQEVRNQATNLRTSRFPEAPQPPFADVVDYWQGLKRAFDPVRDAGGSLPPWAEALQTQLRAVDTLQSAVVAACVATFTRWQNEVAKTPQAAAGLTAVRAAKTRALELFPSAQSQLDLAIPDETLATAETEVVRSTARQQWLAESDRLTGQLAGVATLADWTAASAGIGTSLTTLRGSVPADADPAVNAALKRLGESADRWSSAVEALATIDKSLGAGELTTAARTARTRLSSNEGRTEFTLANDVAGLCVTAFDTLGRTLAIDTAETSLQEAQTKLRGTTILPAATGRIDTWLEAVGRLRTAANGMVAIPGGKARGSATATEPFYLAATECSRAEYAEFLTQLRTTAGAGEAAEQWERVRERLTGTGLNADRLRNLLGRDMKPARLPIDNANWYEAAAFTAWRGRVLPNRQEWTLAALGDGGRTKYPWGDAWPPDGKSRSSNNTSTVEVDADGLSWRSADGPKLHHLGGNVAEWLAADEGSPQATLAGSRYSDSDATVKEQAAGLQVVTADKADGRKGFGFRTALRLRSFPGLDWPR